MSNPKPLTTFFSQNIFMVRVVSYPKQIFPFLNLIEHALSLSLSIKKLDY